MKDLLIFLAVTIISFWLGYKLGLESENKEQRTDRRAGGKKKIMEMLTLRSRPPLEGRITNDEVQKLLNVSDAAATLYLEELEKEKRIKQKGKGRGVYYIKNG